MELNKDTLERFRKEVEVRFWDLNTILEGKEFTTMKETPWTGCIDNEWRKTHRYIDKMEFDTKLADFETIIKQLKNISKYR